MRAKAPWGPAATAAFLERAVALSLDPSLKVNALWLRPRRNTTPARRTLRWSS